MTNPTHSPKIKSWHLDRSAIVYVRQSTPQQVSEHQESTARQYALVGRAADLGWPRDRVVLIDDDLGRSGQTIEGKVSEVSINQRAVKDLQQLNGHLILPSKYFQAGENLVVLQ